MTILLIKIGYSGEDFQRLDQDTSKHFKILLGSSRDFPRLQETTRDFKTLPKTSRDS